MHPPLPWEDAIIKNSVEAGLRKTGGQRHGRSYFSFFTLAVFPLSRLYMTWLLGFMYCFDNNSNRHHSIEEHFRQNEPYIDRYKDSHWWIQDYMRILLHQKRILDDVGPLYYAKTKFLSYSKQSRRYCKLYDICQYHIHLT
jgi:hypothetical protein